MTTLRNPQYGPGTGSGIVIVNRFHTCARPIDIRDARGNMPTVRAVVRFAFVPVLVLTLGLHWALLQTVAWTGMIVTYSQANPLRDAVRMTFDGQHPCTMCKAINQGRAEEKQQEKLAPVTKLPLAIIWQAPLFCFHGERQLISSPDSSCATRTEAPPKPRPRSLAPSHRA